MARTPQQTIDVADINSAIETGGERYWRRIYLAYFAPIKHFIAREYHVDEDIAEELSFKTLLKLVSSSKKPHFGHERQFISWLFKAARSSALDYYKSLDGQFARATDAVESYDEFTIELPASNGNGTVTEELVREVLEQMQGQEVRILNMRANATPYKMIAEEFGIKENVARTYFDRAKRKFSKLYTAMKGHDPV